MQIASTVCDFSDLKKMIQLWPWWQPDCGGTTAAAKQLLGRVEALPCMSLGDDMQRKMTPSNIIQEPCDKKKTIYQTPPKN